MLSQLTALDMLHLGLIIGLVSAVFGWLGGVGGTLMLRVDVARTKALATTLTLSARGEKGAAVSQANREKLSKADREAEELAAQFAAAQAMRSPKRGPRSLREAISAEPLPTDEQFAEEVGAKR